jgi:peptide chain release factor 1
MLDRLQIVKQRFDEISDLIIQPELFLIKRYELNYKTLKSISRKRDEYI